MRQLFLNYPHPSQEDPIDQLRLTNRSHNALIRSGICTVGEVAQLVESGKIKTIRGLGKKSVLEIKSSIVDVKISNKSEVIGNSDVIPRDVSIVQLKLTNRSHNALIRSGIRTVGEVAQLVESGKIKTIRGLGRKCIQEIRGKLTQIGIHDVTKVEAYTPTTSKKMNVEIIPEHVIKWQSQLIAKQLSAELLHEQAKIVDRSVKDWLKIGAIETNTVYEVSASILSSSLNICEEIEFLLHQISGEHCLTILLSRYGFNQKTLRQIGQEIGVTRERVRQIDNELKNNMSANPRTIFEAKSISALKGSSTLLRMQSALLIARDIGLDINYEQWAQRIRSSGLIGNWKSQDFVGRDAVEVMIAICNMLTDCKVPCLQIPKNLQYALQLVAAGTPNVPAKILHASETLSSKVNRLINRHTKHSGSVYAKWLSQEIGRELDETIDILQVLGYRMVSEGWFILKTLTDSHLRLKKDVFNQCLRKIFQYCGPVSIDDVCSGLRHVLSRTKFPVPSPVVMDEIVRIHGYKCEGKLYDWDGPYDANLNASENIIMDCLERIGPVVHHSELVRAFIASNLSIPALPATLNHSPLFEKIETALYKLRGRSINYQDLERAKSAGDRQFLNTEVEYDTDGNVIVSFTVSAIVIGLGTVICERFPNLNGNDWDCYIQGEDAGKLNITENEFRRLKKPLELLNCQPGDRLKFIFNTWKRTVTIEKVGINAK